MIAPVQETLPLDEVNPCRFVVLSEDATTRESAMRVYNGLLLKFEVELAFGLNFWKLKDLANPFLAHQAAEALARADVLLLSVRGHNLPLEMVQWLEVSSFLRRKNIGVLALIVAGSPGLDVVVAQALLYQALYLANRLRMDFLPLIPTVVNARTDGAEALAWHEVQRKESGYDHSGLNE